MARTWAVGAVVALLTSTCAQAPSRPTVRAGDVEGPSRLAATAPAGTPATGAVSPSRPPGRVSPAAEPPQRTTSPAPTLEAEVRREPRRSFLTIRAIGLHDFPVVRYRGTPDDAPGTRIQDSGPTASPRGPGGGVGPGEVGNFIVTGHRTSHSAPFAYLPRLRSGDRVEVRSGTTVFVYEVTGTRSTSFRSQVSLARQSAPVPGRPGVEPTEPMITLSTCATLEDHAAGNYWADELGNPEHRIDEIGVLVATRPARGR